MEELNERSQFFKKFNVAGYVEPFLRTFDFSSDAVRLEVFAIEMSGALHREGRQFLRAHATATDPHNPGILKTLSVAVQTARAKCVIIASVSSMDRHILNGDMLKARRSTKGSRVAKIGEASIQSKLRGPSYYLY